MPDRETGFCIPYGVEKTDDKGMGVFARDTIRKGSIVWRHAPGIFVVYDEHSFRAKIENMPHADVAWELTHVHAFKDFPGCLIRALDDGVLINHSSKPNISTNKAGTAKSLLDVNSHCYLHRVNEALLDDRYALVAIRDIKRGEELANDYRADDDCPLYYDVLCEQYGVREDFLNDS